ncbi:Hypothetical protein MVR_LOCUS57 [uncultured virus]|nr:Hypothetical protein MVR_LOCUS57 [uncultured virus]
MYNPVYINSKLATITEVMCLDSILIGDDDATTAKRNKDLWLFGKTCYSHQEAMDVVKDVKSFTMIVPKTYDELTWTCNEHEAVMFIGQLDQCKLKLSLKSSATVNDVYLLNLGLSNLEAKDSSITNLNISNCKFTQGLLEASSKIANLHITGTSFDMSGILIDDFYKRHSPLPDYNNAIHIDRCKFIGRCKSNIITWIAGDFVGSNTVSNIPTSHIIATNCYINIPIPFIGYCPLTTLVMINNYISSCVTLLKADYSNIIFTNNTMPSDRSVVVKSVNRSQVSNSFPQSFKISNMCAFGNWKQTLKTLKRIGCGKWANQIKFLTNKYTDDECQDATCKHTACQDEDARIAVHNRTFDASVAK